MNWYFLSKHNNVYSAKANLNPSHNCESCLWIVILGQMTHRPTHLRLTCQLTSCNNIIFPINYCSALCPRVFKVKLISMTPVGANSCSLLASLTTSTINSATIAQDAPCVIFQVVLLAGKTSSNVIKNKLLLFLSTCIEYEYDWEPHNEISISSTHNKYWTKQTKISPINFLYVHKYESHCFL